MDAAKDTHDQRAVHGCGQSLADYVADVETDEAVGQAKEVDEISADLEERSEAKCDFDAAVAKRCGGEKGILNDAGFAHVIFADATAVERFHF